MPNGTRPPLGTYYSQYRSKVKACRVVYVCTMLASRAAAEAKEPMCDHRVIDALASGPPDWIFYPSGPCGYCSADRQIHRSGMSFFFLLIFLSMESLNWSLDVEVNRGSVCGIMSAPQSQAGPRKSMKR